MLCRVLGFREVQCRPAPARAVAVPFGAQSYLLLRFALFPGQLSHRPRGDHKPEEIVMNLFAQKVQRFLTSEDGPTAVEYAVMLALIVIVCLTAIRAIGTNANQTFTDVAAQLGS